MLLSRPDLIGAIGTGKCGAGLMLRKLILGGSAWVLLGAAAPAADLPAQTKIPTGHGAILGRLLSRRPRRLWLGRQQFQTIPGRNRSSPFSRRLQIKGAVVGAHAGYNWQSGRTVTGLEIDCSAADISGSSRAIRYSGHQTVDRTDRLKYLGTARGRLGWLPADHMLIYGTAGVAWERFETSYVRTTPAFNINSNVTTPFDRFGWVAGAGIEAMPFGPQLDRPGRIPALRFRCGRAGRPVP